MKNSVKNHVIFLLKGNKMICVIGAGSSGLAAIKACKEERLNVVCYEKTESHGGLWRYHPDDSKGIPSVMRSTVINTSKEMSAFSDFPPPKMFANFMHNKKMLKYFTLYAEKFDLLKHIAYKHEVTRIEMTEDYESTGKWVVSIKKLDDSTEIQDIFDGVMVCCGHHTYPYTPEFEGLEDFGGKVIHTHSLKSSDGFEEKRVVVVGIGNSAVDAAVEISRVSKKLYLSSRKGSWIFPRLGPNGNPFDIFLQKRFFQNIRYYDPIHLADKALETWLNFKFNHAKYRLKPTHRATNAHITINDPLPNCIMSGLVTVAANVERFTKNGVIFRGEKEVTNIDCVVLATGYEIKYNFLPENILQLNEKSVNLYKLTFPFQLKHPTLAFIALVQPLGSMFPIAEAQSRWFVQLLKGNVKLPPQDVMEQEACRRVKEKNENFVPSLRHIVEVEWIPYMDEIYSEIGAKPNLWKLFISDPRLYISCMFGPCTPYQYRLYGPHSWDGARNAIFSAWDRIDAPFKTCKRD